METCFEVHPKSDMSGEKNCKIEIDFRASLNLLHGNDEINFTIRLLPYNMKDEEERPDSNFVDVITNIDYYNPDSNDAPTSNSEYYTKASVVLTIVTNVAIILSVLMSAILGVKYMLGSVEERADYKKTLLPYFVGAFLVFGILTVIKILQGIGETINNI